MAKEVQTKYQVEGPDWKLDVVVDTTLYSTDKDLLIEIATQAFESRLKDTEDFNVGPIVSVRKVNPSGSLGKKALVNSFICLSNAGRYGLAELLRENFKKETGGQDLALDEQGFSWE